MSRRTARILLVDNGREILTLFKKKIETDSEGAYRVLTARNEREARRALDDSKIDLAVVDLHLISDIDSMDYSGYRLALEIARLNLPVIIMTISPNYELIRDVERLDSTLASLITFWGKEEKSESVVDMIDDMLIGRRVFIVHGHDTEALSQVQNEVFQMRLYPLVLQREPGYSDTIIEKLENLSNVGYIIVILTGDDLGAKKGDDPALESRVRENVIFELGYFVGKYGRKHVSLLKTQEVNIISDLAGVEYIHYAHDDKEWSKKLRQNMRFVWPKLPSL